MRKILEKCPSCGGDLLVTRMTCPSCGTVVTGTGTPCRFCQISPEHTRLLEAFVRARGNVREMARELESSYWTVRKQVDELVEALGAWRSWNNSNVARSRRTKPDSYLWN